VCDPNNPTHVLSCPSYGSLAAAITHGLLKGND
jgi:hypothetical protein